MIMYDNSGDHNLHFSHKDTEDQSSVTRLRPEVGAGCLQDPPGETTAGDCLLAVHASEPSGKLPGQGTAEQGRLRAWEREGSDSEGSPASPWSLYVGITTGTSQACGEALVRKGIKKCFSNCRQPRSV